MSPKQLERLREISDLCEQGKVTHKDLQQLNDMLAKMKPRTASSKTSDQAALNVPNRSK